MPSPDQREYAARLLRKAGEDLAVVRALLENESIADDAIGFHAQQAVEKAMKSVLVIHGVAWLRGSSSAPSFYRCVVGNTGEESGVDLGRAPGNALRFAGATAMSRASGLPPLR